MNGIIAYKLARCELDASAGGLVPCAERVGCDGGDLSAYNYIILIYVNKIRQIRPFIAIFNYREFCHESKPSCTNGRFFARTAFVYAGCIVVWCLQKLVFGEDCKIILCSDNE